MKPATERRRTRRHRARLPVELRLPGASGAGGKAVVEDVSLSGVRCTTDHALPVMTQVGLVLVLPGSGGVEHHVNCQGVVVRCRPTGSHSTDASVDPETVDGPPDGPGEHETAIFFTSMSDGDRLQLDDFLRLSADIQRAGEALDLDA